MKLRKFSKIRNKLLKLKLIKSKSYDDQLYLKNIALKNVELRLKKLYFIIHKYHKLKKRILFIETGVINNLELKKILRPTNHISIHENEWQNGIITNTSSVLKNASSKHEAFVRIEFQKSMIKEMQSSDLVVVLGKPNLMSFLEESIALRKPTILISDTFFDFKLKPSFTVIGNFEFKVYNKSSRDFIYSILEAVIKKKWEPKK